MSPVLVALGLTFFAGAATGIGSAIALMAKRTNYRFLSISTGFSAGVMLYVSFVEIFFKGMRALESVYGEVTGAWINVSSFFGGILLIGIIDNLIPSAENPHEVYSKKTIASIKEHGDQPADALLAAEEDQDRTKDSDTSLELPSGAHHHSGRHRKLMRMGIFTALAIAIHNFPEGLATFLSALKDPTLGVAIAIAIALHNIPEGISVAVPIFYATGSRMKAFVYSFLSGLAEPVGAIIAYGVILLAVGGGTGDVVIPDSLMGIMFAGVAGIMVYISLDELLPTSRAYGKGHDSLFGLIGGMVIMALSLLLMM